MTFMDVNVDVRKWFTRLCLFTVFFLYVVSANATGWLPNIVHYINQSPNAKNSELALALSDESLSGTNLIDWHSFAPQGYEYVLYYRLAGESEWQILYQGTESHYQSELPFDTGSYEFRVDCTGVVGCPSSGFIQDSMTIIEQPAFVNLAYSHEKNQVEVKWGESTGAVGYTLDQSLDRGDSWQPVDPKVDSGIDYSGEDFQGVLHSENTVVITQSEVQESIETYIGTLLSEKSGRVEVSLSDYNMNTEDSLIGTSLQYRVRACADPRCGQSKDSPILDIISRKNIFPDSSFEQGAIQFTDDVGATSILEQNQTIRGKNSLTINLRNYGLSQYIHRYAEGSNPYLNGVSLKALIRINHLDENTLISIYPVAYYVGQDRRVEGQKLMFSAADIGKTLAIDNQLWLNFDPSSEDNKIKRIHFLVRVVGKGNAQITLDDVSLFEGAGLAQTDPTLTAYYSVYDGIVKFSWSEFLPHNSTYRLQYKRLNEVVWQDLYNGKDLFFKNVEPFEDSDLYQFRMRCIGAGNCPSSGYVTAETVVAREPAFIKLTRNFSAKTTEVSWAETVSALGYLLEYSSDNGVNWVNIEPSESDSKFTYMANDLVRRTVFADTKMVWPSNIDQDTKFRVKSCRWAGCNGRFRESDNLRVLDVQINLMGASRD